MRDNRILEVLSSFAQYFSILIASGLLMVLTALFLLGEEDCNLFACPYFVIGHVTAIMAATIATFSVLLYGSDVCKTWDNTRHIVTNEYSRLCIFSGWMVGLSFFSYFMGIVRLMEENYFILTKVILAMFFAAMWILFIYFNPNLTVTEP